MAILFRAAFWLAAASVPTTKRIPCDALSGLSATFATLGVAQVPDGVTVLNVRLLPLTWIVRTRGDVGRQVEAALQTASAGLPATRPRYMDEVARDSIAR